MLWIVGKRVRGEENDPANCWNKGVDLYYAAWVSTILIEKGGKKSGRAGCLRRKIKEGILCLTQKRSEENIGTEKMQQGAPTAQRGRIVLLNARQFISRLNNTN